MTTDEPSNKPSSASLSSLMYDAIEQLHLEPKTTAEVMTLFARFGDARWWDGYEKAKEMVITATNRRVDTLLDEIKKL